VDFLVLITVLMFKTLVFMAVGVIFIVTAFANNSKFQEGFYQYYDVELNRWGLIVYVFFLLLVCLAIVFFTASLLLLHIKLK